MAPQEDESTDARNRQVSRCRVLATTGGVALAGLAGCTSVTSQKFTATPIRLPEAVWEELRLAKTFADSANATCWRTVVRQEFEVTVTNHFAGYTRSRADPTHWAAPRLTLVERFTGFAPEMTPGSRSSINAVAAKFGLGRTESAFVEEDARVDPDAITLVIPERARNDGEGGPEKVMTLYLANALVVNDLTSRGGYTYLSNLPNVLPARWFSPQPGARTGIQRNGGSTQMGTAGSENAITENRRETTS